MSDTPALIASTRIFWRYRTTGASSTSGLASSSAGLAPASISISRSSSLTSFDSFWPVVSANLAIVWPSLSPRRHGSTRDGLNRVGEQPADWPDRTQRRNRFRACAAAVRVGWRLILHRPDPCRCARYRSRLDPSSACRTRATRTLRPASRSSASRAASARRNRCWQPAPGFAEPRRHTPTKARVAPWPGRGR